MSQSNYEALRLHLDGLDVDEWATTFAEIESLLGFRLPESARVFNAWWSNSLKGRPGAIAWREAGFRASVRMEEERVIFRRGLERPAWEKALGAAGRVSRLVRPDPASLLDGCDRRCDQQCSCA